jgi:hypothetical protein
VGNFQNQHAINKLRKGYMKGKGGKAEQYNTINTLRKGYIVVIS